MRPQIAGLPVLAAAVMAAAWLTNVLWRAAHAPVWMDEVLTLWLIRMPGPAAIYRALAQGAQYTPPAHPDLLFYWSKLAGQSYLALRLPSIAATLVTAGAISLLLRRYVAPSIASAGFILCLCPPLSDYATQIRPYALTIACFAVALLLWDGLRTHPRSLPSLAGIALCLGAAVSLHLYCIFYVAAFAVIEGVYELRIRRPRRLVWIGLGLAAASTALWLPLIRDFQHFTRADRGPLYYAAPTLPRFLLSLIALSAESLFFLVMAALLALAAAGFNRRTAPDPQRQPTHPLLAIAIGTACLPFLTYVGAVFVTGTYSGRYVLPGALAAILFAALAANSAAIPAKSAVVPLAALLVGVLSLMRTHEPVPTARFSDVLASAGKPYPIALAEGLLFFAAEEDRTLTATQRARFVYLTVPPSYPFGDPTNESQVKRWKTIDPALPVAPVDTLLSTRQCFYVFDTRQTEDDLTYYLERLGLKPAGIAHTGKGDLSEFCPIASQS